MSHTFLASNIDLSHAQRQHNQRDTLEETQTPEKLLTKLPEEADEADLRVEIIVNCLIDLANAIVLPAGEAHIVFVDRASDAKCN